MDRGMSLELEVRMDRMVSEVARILVGKDYFAARDMDYVPKMISMRRDQVG
jgi:hypothetical protein